MNAYIATDSEDTVILVVDGEISHAINPNCPEWAGYEQHIAVGGTLIEAQPSEAHMFIGGAWVLDGNVLAKLQVTFRAECERAISALIQGEVDAYNAANNVIFADVHSCQAYAGVDGYSHQAFCAAVWAWNVAVWEAARVVLAAVIAGERAVPTVSELLAELPVFEF